MTNHRPYELHEAAAFPEICHGWLQRVVAVVVMRLISEPVALAISAALNFSFLSLFLYSCTYCAGMSELTILSSSCTNTTVNNSFSGEVPSACAIGIACHSTGQSNDRGQILPDQHFVVSVSTVGRNRMVGVWVRVICRPEDGMSGRILQTTPSRFATAPPAGANSRPRWRGCRV